jgi:hypothetical protein
MNRFSFLLFRVHFLSWPPMPLVVASAGGYVAGLRQAGQCRTWDGGRAATSRVGSIEPGRVNGAKRNQRLVGAGGTRLGGPVVSSAVRCLPPRWRTPSPVG